MGIFDVFRKKRIGIKEIPPIVARLGGQLSIIREQFVFASVTTIKGEGVSVTGINQILEPGSELDAALKGYQFDLPPGF